MGIGVRRVVGWVGVGWGCWVERGVGSCGLCDFYCRLPAGCRRVRSFSSVTVRPY